MLFEALEIDENYTTIGEYSSGGFEFSIVESLDVISFQSKQAQTLKKFSDFKSSHEFFHDTGVSIGLTAINAYTKNQQLTAKLFAKTAFEKKFYGTMIADMVKSGLYKVVSKRYTNGGIMTELQRIKK